jgi:amidase
MENLAFASAGELARRLRAREIGCLELLDLYIQRVERLDPPINAVVVRRFAEARREARERDAALARGEDLGPLHGLPMTVKESFDLPGLPTTFGFPEHIGNVAERPALAVERLQRAGAVIFGKTNVPVGLADWQSFNPIYGVTKNPWNLERGPGGSSGGGAAALAAGFCGLELGSDIGASIRNPAHYCGVYGHKPSFEIAARVGHSLPGMYAPSDISVIGPLARSAFDLELALNVVAGPSGRDGRAWRLELPPARKTRLSEYRVAVMTSDPTAEVDAAVADEIEKLAGFLEGQGAKVDRRARPVDPARAHEVYVLLLRAATSGRLPEGAREAQLRARETLGARDDYYAWFVRGNTMSHWEWLRLNNERHKMRLDWERFFQEHDLLLCPTAATTAFPHNPFGERWERMITVNGKDQPVTTQLFWAGYSGMVYLPSTVAPIAIAADGLPVGVQIVGPQYEDLTCIRFAQLLEREYRGFAPPPGLA